jgi:hypothetical protein
MRLRKAGVFRYYQGWNIEKYNEEHDGSKTNRVFYIASRYGVTINAGTLEDIKNMINVKNSKPFSFMKG